MADRVDPYKGFNFRVEIDNTKVAGFREAGGLNFQIEVAEYREGTDARLHTRKLPALRKFSSNITLKRGITDNKELWNWYKELLNGSLKRRNGAIILMDEEQKDVLRWNFENGFICKWDGPTMNATSNEVAIEAIEICVEHVELE